MKVGNKVGGIILFGVVSEIVFQAVDPIYKLMMIYAYIFVILPIILFYLRALMIEYFKQEKILQAQNRKGNNNNSGADYKVKNENNYNPPPKKFIPKIVENDTYILLRDCFKAMIQNKQLSNSQIVAFLSVIDIKLGNHLYNYMNFSWKNQAQQIYTKLKSGKFKEDDYRILYNELIRISCGLEECELDYYQEAISFKKLN